MSGSFVKGCVVGLVCALLGGATVALAGSGIGGVFNLGVSNTVDAQTKLTGASPGAQLQVTNTNAVAGASGLVATSKSSSATLSAANSSTGAGVYGNSTGGIGVFAQSGNASKPGLYARNTLGGPAGSFVVNAGVSPFAVNSQTKVTNLNADRFDGFDSTSFLRNLVPLSLTGATATDGVISATNTGAANGLQGKSGATLASGVYGENIGGGYGVAGRSNAPLNDAIDRAATYGENTAGGRGVLGLSNQPNGIGVEGQGGDYGVVGVGVGTGGYFKGYHGVIGESSGGYAGYFIGKLGATGDLNVSGTKNFRIDDPLDPSDKYLVHAAIESDQALDVYSGNMTTDSSGLAVVQLPAWFDRINTDYRYQLTIVGTRGWNARISEEIKDNQFTIQTDQPNVRVSWQVTALRNDPYMRAHPFQAEQAKTGAEQGKYVTPQAYGQPASASIEKRPPAPQPPTAPSTP
jgi:hypothetical protein